MVQIHSCLVHSGCSWSSRWLISVSSPETKSWKLKKLTSCLSDLCMGDCAILTVVDIYTKIHWSWYYLILDPRVLGFFAQVTVSPATEKLRYREWTFISYLVCSFIEHARFEFKLVFCSLGSALEVMSQTTVNLRWRLQDKGKNIEQVSFAIYLMWWLGKDEVFSEFQRCPQLRFFFLLQHKRCFLRSTPEV